MTYVLFIIAGFFGIMSCMFIGDMVAGDKPLSDTLGGFVFAFVLTLLPAILGARRFRRGRRAPIEAIMHHAIELASQNGGVVSRALILQRSRASVRMVDLAMEEMRRDGLLVPNAEDEDSYRVPGAVATKSAPATDSGDYDAEQGEAMARHGRTADGWETFQQATLRDPPIAFNADGTWQAADGPVMDQAVGLVDARVGSARLDKKPGHGEELIIRLPDTTLALRYAKDGWRCQRRAVDSLTSTRPRAGGTGDDAWETFSSGSLGPLTLHEDGSFQSAGGPKFDQTCTFVNVGIGDSVFDKKKGAGEELTIRMGDATHVLRHADGTWYYRRSNVR